MANKVRDAALADLPALTLIKGKDSEALHLDRLRDAQGTGFRYFVFLLEEEIIGSACLVMIRPSSWSDADDKEGLPQIVDLQIMESYRGQGYGSAFIQAIEEIAKEAGHKYLYISVEPLDNPRAYALYQRLAYQQLQSEPFQRRWQFTDSGGSLHQGKDWVVDMVKSL